MALRDWIRQGSRAAIPAIPAIPANDAYVEAPTIAKIAGIALAKPTKAESASVANYDQDSIAVALRQFRFDLIEGTADSVQEIDRVNNMAWEFMKVDDLPFTQAIRLAAEIVVSCEVRSGEAAYEGVHALWRRLGEPF
jgi:hypothetical protein